MGGTERNGDQSARMLSASAFNGPERRKVAPGGRVTAASTTTGGIDRLASRKTWVGGAPDDSGSSRRQPAQSSSFADARQRASSLPRSAMGDQRPALPPRRAGTPPSTSTRRSSPPPPSRRRSSPPPARRQSPRPMRAATSRESPPSRSGRGRESPPPPQRRQLEPPRGEPPRTRSRSSSMAASMASSRPPPPTKRAGESGMDKDKKAGGLLDSIWAKTTSALSGGKAGENEIPTPPWSPAPSQRSRAMSNAGRMTSSPPPMMDRRLPERKRTMSFGRGEDFWREDAALGAATRPRQGPPTPAPRIQQSTLPATGSTSRALLMHTDTLTYHSLQKSQSLPASSSMSREAKLTELRVRELLATFAAGGELAASTVKDEDGEEETQSITWVRPPAIFPRDLGGAAAGAKKARAAFKDPHGWLVPQDNSPLEPFLFPRSLTRAPTRKTPAEKKVRPMMVSAQTDPGVRSPPGQFAAPPQQAMPMHHHSSSLSMSDFNPPPSMQPLLPPTPLPHQAHPAFVRAGTALPLPPPSVQPPPPHGTGFWPPPPPSSAGLGVPTPRPPPGFPPTPFPYPFPPPPPSAQQQQQSRAPTTAAFYPPPFALPVGAPTPATFPTSPSPSQIPPPPGTVFATPSPLAATVPTPPNVASPSALTAGPKAAATQLLAVTAPAEVTVNPAPAPKADPTLNELEDESDEKEESDRENELEEESLEDDDEEDERSTVAERSLPQLGLPPLALDFGLPSISLDPLASPSPAMAKPSPAASTPIHEPAKATDGDTGELSRLSSPAASVGEEDVDGNGGEEEGEEAERDAGVRLPSGSPSRLQLPVLGGGLPSGIDSWKLPDLGFDFEDAKAEPIVLGRSQTPVVTARSKESCAQLPQSSFRPSPQTSRDTSPPAFQGTSPDKASYSSLADNSIDAAIRETTSFVASFDQASVPAVKHAQADPNHSRRIDRWLADQGIQPGPFRPLALGSDDEDANSNGPNVGMETETTRSSEGYRPRTAPPSSLPPLATSAERYMPDREAISAAKARLLQPDDDTPPTPTEITRIGEGKSVHRERVLSAKVHEEVGIWGKHEAAEDLSYLAASNKLQEVETKPVIQLKSRDRAKRKARPEAEPATPKSVSKPVRKVEEQDDFMASLRNW